MFPLALLWVCHSIRTCLRMRHFWSWASQAEPSPNQPAPGSCGFASNNKYLLFKPPTFGVACNTAVGKSHNTLTSYWLKLLWAVICKYTEGRAGLVFIIRKFLSNYYLNDRLFLHDMSKNNLPTLCGGLNTLLDAGTWDRIHKHSPLHPRHWYMPSSNCKTRTTTPKAIQTGDYKTFSFQGSLSYSQVS